MDKKKKEKHPCHQYFILRGKFVGDFNMGWGKFVGDFNMGTL
jgi:hypothetical protein